MCNVSQLGCIDLVSRVMKYFKMKDWTMCAYVTTLNVNPNISMPVMAK